MNEFQSGKWDDFDVEANDLTAGESILVRFGFTLADGEPFGYEWVWYGILLAVGMSFIAVFASTYFLANLRYETGKPLGFANEEEEDADVPAVEIPFQKVNLTFRDIHYTVTASTSNEKLELLKGVDGFIEAGKMTALMGSSGAVSLATVCSIHEFCGLFTLSICSVCSCRVKRL